MASMHLGSYHRSLPRYLTITLTCTLFLAAMACSHCPGQEKVERIPLASIYATHAHDGMKRVSFASNSLPLHNTNENFMGLSPHASNLFLIRAQDLTDATQAALRFRGSTQLSLPKRGEKSEVWLVVYFGFGSSDANDWRIQSVERSASKIVVTYAPPRKNIVRTAGASPFFVFVPLQGVTAGNYELQLVDSATKRVTLMRKTRVSTTDK